MMENYLYIMYNQINKAMQKIMRSLFIATLLLVSMGMGAYAQETKKTFTPKQQEMIDLSNIRRFYHTIMNIKCTIFKLHSILSPWHIDVTWCSYCICKCNLNQITNCTWTIPEMKVCWFCTNQCAYLWCDKEVAYMLKVSRRTLSEYRSNGTLPYYVLGGKVLYKRSEIEQALKREYNGKHLMSSSG